MAALCLQESNTGVLLLSEGAYYTTFLFSITKRNPRKIFVFTKKAVIILMKVFH